MYIKGIEMFVSSAIILLFGLLILYVMYLHPVVFSIIGGSVIGICLAMKIQNELISK